jgi:PAS domain S-box-containing protein
MNVMNNLSKNIDFQAIFDSSPDLYLVLDTDLNIIGVSNAYLNATMVKRNEIMGRGIFDVFPDNPNDPEATGVRNLRTSLERVLKNKSPDTMAIQKYDIRRPMSEGGGFEERYWSPVNSPILGKNKQVQYIIHRVEDVTEFILLKKSGAKQLQLMEELRTRAGEMEIEIYRRAQEIQKANHLLENSAKELKIKNQQLKTLNASIKEKEERLKLALQASGTGTWTWDCINDIIEVDDNMPLIFGFRSKEDFPKNYSDFFKYLYPDDRLRVDREIKKSLTESVKYNTEYRVIWPDGSKHVIAARGLMYTNEKNEPIKMAGVCLDITEKDQAKKQLAQLAKDLKINNQKLETSNERFKEFAYIVSHDLQEPLRMVINFMQLLQSRYHDKLDKDAEEFIEFAVNGGIRMKTLISDLLVYSRVESQGKPLKEVSMEEPLNWTLTNLQEAIKEANAKISYDPLPQVLGDTTQLGQLLQNLIANAIRYRKTSQSLKIHIGAIEENENWKLFVKDNGIGIDPQFHDRIFKIFQRLHTYEEYEGTGIGLAVCKRIVDRHGGKIWVESTPDQGSTFYFLLPKPTQETQNDIYKIAD